MTSFIDNFLRQTAIIANELDRNAIEKVALGIAKVRDEGGRLFILGVGGSAANASHAVNDFRKLCNVEAYAPTDNVSELTARTNDEGWHTVFVEWLKTSKLCERDAILVMSVGGGNEKANVSMNLIHALQFAKSVGLKVFGIVGRDGGYARKVADAIVVVPTVDKELVTPHTEAFQAVIWHCLVSHPVVKVNSTKW